MRWRKNAWKLSRRERKYVMRITPSYRRYMIGKYMQYGWNFTQMIRDMQNNHNPATPERSEKCESSAAVTEE
jgi:hypothetical protein